MPQRRAAASASAQACPSGAARQTGRDDHGARHTGGPAPFDDARHGGRRHGDHGEIGNADDCRDPLLPDDTHGAVERSAEVPIACPASSLCVSTEHDDVAWAEDRLERADGAAPVAQVSMILQQVIGGEIELHVHGTVLEPTAGGPGRRRAKPHTDVVRASRPPAAGTRLAGDAGEILEQHRGDALRWCASATANATSASSPPGRA